METDITYLLSYLLLILGDNDIYIVTIFDMYPYKLIKLEMMPCHCLSHTLALRRGVSKLVFYAQSTGAVVSGRLRRGAENLIRKYL